MNQLAEKTIAKIKTTPGYHFRESIVIEICEAGINGIQVGTVLHDDGDQKLIRSESDIVCVDVKTGNETRRTPIAGNEDRIVGMWAEKKSRLGHSIGRI